MRRIIISLIVLTLLAPGISRAQGRLFAKGDSGLALDVSSSAWTDYGTTKRALKFGALYTYRGQFDLGIRTGGVDEDNLDRKGWTIYGRALLLDPGRPRGWGLELQGSYYALTRDSDLPFLPHPPFTEYLGASGKEQIVMAGLRGYYRWAAKAKSRFILGFMASYRYKKDEVLDASGDVLLGQEFGGWGLSVDIVGVEFGWLLLMARLDYIQNRDYFSDPVNLTTDTMAWDIVTTWGVGFLFGMDHSEETANE